MEKGDYNMDVEFATHMRLIFSNCYRYNPPKHDVVVMAKEVEVRNLDTETCRKNGPKMQASCPLEWVKCPLKMGKMQSCGNLTL